MILPAIVIEHPEMLRPVTELEIAETSVALGFELPPSYVSFVRAYGFGRLGGLLHILVPSSGAEGLARFGPALRERLAVTVEAGLDDSWSEDDRRLASVMTPFGSSEDGHILGFGDPTSEGEREIVVFGADGETRYRGGASFRELLERLFGERVRQTLGPGYLPLPPVFLPAKAR